MYIETAEQAAPSVSPAAGVHLRGAQPGGGRAPHLRYILVLVDFAAAMAGWASAVHLANGPGLVPSGSSQLLLVGLLAAATVVLAGANQLYRARVCRLRSVEIQRLTRVALAVGGLAFFLGPRLGVTAAVRLAVLGSVVTLGLGIVLRGAFRSWLQACRKGGRFLRRVVLVGANADARNVLSLVDGHPEDGYTVVGVIGDDEEQATGMHCPYLGRLDDTVEALRRADANGVIIAATAWTSDELNRLMRRLVAEGIHIHLSTGVQGIAQSRMRPLPLAYEPLFYIEPTTPSVAQLAVKRAMDIVVASLILIASLPVLALAALAIKLQDGGPVLFRQPRVGASGRHFTILKLRTMTVDAERRYAELAITQSGRTGPLVKLNADPRITRIGRFLRASSIDELPQLLNVFGGTMSVVGPRPIQPVEAEAIDSLFLAQKTAVRPGITGLWQVEARDNPSFEEYRRYDIYYLENWTVGLDAAIMLSTAFRVISRAVRLVRMPTHGSGATVTASARLE